MALVNDFGESKVTVKKSELLEKLKTNRGKHKEDFVTAIKGFRIEAIEKLEQHLVAAKAGEKIEQHLYLDEPTEHTKDYDLVIAMLEMSTADEIMVTSSQFRQYVMDEWNWKEAFANSSQMYLAKAAAARRG